MSKNQEQHRRAVIATRTAASLRCTRPLALAAIAAAALGLGACTAVQPRLPAGSGMTINRVGVTSNGAAIWSRAEQRLADAGQNTADLPEFARRDSSLNPSTPTPQLATLQWPQPEPPALERPRYLYLSPSFFSSSTTVLFFVPDDRPRR